MRLLMFRDGAGRRLGVLRSGTGSGPRGGVEERGEVIDLAAAAAAAGAPAPPADLLALIDEGDEGLARVAELAARPEAVGAALPLAGLELLAPLDPSRGNVIAIGRNYAKHAAESAAARGGSAEPGPPTVFTKALTSIAGPYDDFTIDPAVSEQIDWEVELGVVIGRGGRGIAREAALDHVFGYTVVNDITARDIQSGWGGQFFKGKSLDGSCPCGPWVVTRDEVPDPQDLRLRLSVNGAVKQDASTRDMIYAVDAIISWVSVGMTLPAGTLIATGTPEGVGFARKPPEFLRPGDLMESEVEGIGTLRNRMVPAAAPVPR